MYGGREQSMVESKGKKVRDNSFDVQRQYGFVNAAYVISCFDAGAAAEALVENFLPKRPQPGSNLFIFHLLCPTGYDVKISVLVEKLHNDFALPKSSSLASTFDGGEAGNLPVDRRSPLLAESRVPRRCRC